MTPSTGLAGRREPPTKMSLLPEQVLVSCEHASNRLPAGMEAPADMLQLHIAWDPGALDIAEALAHRFSAPLHTGEYSRLVVDLNRSEGNSALVKRRSDGHLIPFNRGLTEADVRRRVEQYYRPYRSAVSGGVAQIIERHGRCVHLCIHTYTPQLGDKLRGNDIGLLYDPYRRPEAPLVHELRDALRRRLGMVVWLNRPYSGTADGILPPIRRVHGEDSYVAIELEVNQKYAGRPQQLASIAEVFGESLGELEGWATGGLGAQVSSP